MSKKEKMDIARWGLETFNIGNSENNMTNLSEEISFVHFTKLMVLP